MKRDIFARGTLLVVPEGWSTDSHNPCTVPVTGTLGAGRRALELLFRLPDAMDPARGWRPALLMMGEEKLVCDTGNGAGIRSSLRSLSDRAPGRLAAMPRTPLALSPVPVPRIAVASFALVHPNGTVMYRANVGCSMPVGSDYLGDSLCRSRGLPFAGEPCPPVAAVVVHVPDGASTKRKKDFRFGTLASIYGYHQQRLDTPGAQNATGLRVLLTAACCAHLACAVDEGRLEVRSCPDRPGKIEHDELLVAVSDDYTSSANDYRLAFQNMAKARDEYREQAAIYRALGGVPDSVAELERKENLT